MVRPPCCDEVGLKKGPWTPEEDKLLADYIQEHGHGSWRNLPKSAGLNRCGKSCRLRWTNYLRPDIKRGKFSEEEERLIIHLHSVLGNKWSTIATRLSGRTDNEIKNYWNTHLKKKLLLMGIDPVTHRRRTDLDGLLANLPALLAATNLTNLATTPWDNALRLQADHAAQLARFQLMQTLIQVMSTTSGPSMNLLGGSASLPNYQFNDLFQVSQQLNAFMNGSLSLSQDPTIPTASGLQHLPNNFNEMASQFNNSSCSNDHVAECKDGIVEQMVNSYTFPIATSSTPSLVSASPENPINSNDVSANSSTSTPFDDWKGLCDLDTDLGWKDILDHISKSSES